MDTHCTSLEISKRLKELGIKQESKFYWVGEEENKLFLSNETGRVIGQYFPPDYEDYPIIYSAFLSSELGEILPHRIINNWKGKPSLYIEKEYNDYIDKDWWQIYYKGEDGHCGSCCEEQTLHTEAADTEANARGLMLIYLKENNLI